MVSLPQGFNFLHAVRPDIRQSIRYSTNANFLGRIVEGYSKPYTCLTHECIEALGKVQEAVNVMGYDVLVYDGYRPLRACQDFYNWSTNINDDDEDQSAFYYPNIQKSKLFDSGYLLKLSNHCFGNTVDVSLIRRDKPLQKLNWSYRYYQGYKVPYGDDGSMDMYTSFDLLDIISHHDSTLIPSTFIEKRNLLRHIMEAHGFESYQKEWWHYTLKNATFSSQTIDPFDFVF